MVKREIVWSPTAENCIKGISDYYYEKTGNSKYSSSIILNINNLVSHLHDKPFLGRTTSDKFARVIIHKFYKIYYEVTDSTIIIHGVWDTRRNPDDLNNILHIEP